MALKIKRKKVNSSNILAIGHAEKTLEVRFKGDRVYRYTPVTAEQHKELMDAESCGIWFNENIRGNVMITVREITM